MNRVNVILENIDEMLEDAWKMPLSGGKCVVDIDKMNKLIDEIRLNLPTEIKEAQMIVMDRKNILDNANREASATIKQAQDKATYLIENNEITKAAKERAKEILEQVKVESKQIKQGAFKFSKDILDETENSLTEAINNVKKVKQVLRTPSNNANK